MDNPILRFIIETFPDEDTIVLDGFDDAILGFTTDEEGVRVVYSVAKILDILIDGGLSVEEAVEHFDFNIAGSIFPNGGPVYLYSPSYLPPYERYRLN